VARRTLTQAAALPFGAKIEIQAVAAKATTRLAHILGD
jgi:enamine deaminase RidA (YjgF/YER057c/UK114 family)